MTARRVSAGLLHPKYQMELFRLDINSLDVAMSYEYDHSTFNINLTKTTLYDLTGYPYTVDPKKFYSYIKKHRTLANSPQAAILKHPLELIYFNDMEFRYLSIQSPKCPEKPEGFNGEMRIKISPLRINYV